MTKEEAIKYLQQIYPNGGHCWLDEQRIEAISMAIDALKEEPVSEDLEEASKEWLIPQLDKSYANYGEVKMMELTHFDGYAMLDAIEFGAQWQKEQDSIVSEQLKKVAELYTLDDSIKPWKNLTKEAFKAGTKWQKQQMMKDAVYAECDVILLEEGDELQYSVLYPKGKKPFNKGDKVKLIIVKED